MPSRRRMLAIGACASAGAVSSLVIPGFKPLIAATENAIANDDGTWLTYAVNVEIDLVRRPFPDRLHARSRKRLSRTTNLPVVK